MTEIVIPWEASDVSSQLRPDGTLRHLLTLEGLSRELIERHFASGAEDGLPQEKWKSSIRVCGSRGRGRIVTSCIL